MFLFKTTMSVFAHGVSVPDTKLGRAITEYVYEHESELLFNHSSRVYLFGAIAGRQRGLTFDADMLYAAAMFHDVGLIHTHASRTLRFEVDGANAARTFLRERGVDEADIDKVWTAIALHTTPGVPEHMHPIVALTTAGVEMDVLGLTYDQYTDDVRKEVVKAFPRTPSFKEDIIQAFYDGIKHKPESTFGNVKADVIADKEPHFRKGNFCDVIRSSKWAA